MISAPRVLHTANIASTMRPLHYIEIKNFKLFGSDIQRIDLDHPTVLVGPNNCGKTTVIQALAFWSQAVKTWWATKGEAPPKQRAATSVNRLSIVSVPVRRTRYFWHNAAVRTGNTDILIEITVGIFHNDKIFPVTIRGRNYGEDTVYCTPDEATRQNLDAIEVAAGIDVELLYPLSGLETEEPVVQLGRVKVLLGQGQTAQVMRNLCLMVRRQSDVDWTSIVELIDRLFHVELADPVENIRGSIDLYYRQDNVSVPLDIASAGRGLQQILLILSYLYSNRGSVLLIDEPDAHLEILRQRHVYLLLREIADRSDSQIIIATHSEQILDEAVDHSLTLLLGGRAIPVGDTSAARDALKHYGTEHYLRARQRGYVLYVEGSTDLQLLRGFADKLGHPAALSWDERANVYKVRDNYPEQDLDAELSRVEGGHGLTPKQHFYMMREMVPGIRGLAILDGDKRPHGQFENEALRISYWSRYEIENYLITPELLRMYVTHRHGEESLYVAMAQDMLDELIGERVLTEARQLDAWKRADPATRRVLWEAATTGVKLSDFAEEFFRRLANSLSEPLLMRKADLHRLMTYVDAAELPTEVGEKLDLLHELFEAAIPSEGA